VRNVDDLSKLVDIWISIKWPCLSVQDYSLLCSILYASDWQLLCFDRYRHYVTDEWSTFVNKAWQHAVDCYTLEDSTPEEFLICNSKSSSIQKLIQTLLDAGADPHVSAKWRRVACRTAMSAYRYFLEFSECPIQFRYVLEDWMDVLSSCGVELEGYIAEETRLLVEDATGPIQFRDDIYWIKQIDMIHVFGMQVPAWELGIKPSCIVAEVLGEFVPVGRAWLWHSCPNPHSVLREGLKAATIFGWELDWPFSLSSVHINDDILDCITSALNVKAARQVTDSYRRMRRLINQRFERRQRKRLGMSSSGIMPGSWSSSWE
jgi:hypothetical protein